MWTLAPIDPCSSGIPYQHQGLAGIAVQSKPVPADVAMATSSRRQLEQAPIIQRSLLPLKKRLGQVSNIEKSLLPPKKRVTSDISSGGADDDGSVDTSSGRQLEQPPNIENSLLPPKKRAMSDDCADNSFMIPPKKRLVDAGSDATSSAYGVTHPYDTVTAAPPSSNAIISTVSSEQPLQQKKLRHGAMSTRVFCSHALDGIIEEAETSQERAKKKTKRNRNKRAQPSTTVSLAHKTLCPGTELSGRLQMLNATAMPQFVCKKTLYKSDVDPNQNRLLFSCKPEFLAGHPITALVAGNDKEKYFVHECELGLGVIAFDGHGRKFDIRLRYLVSNGAYRFITGWNTFVEANKLSEAVKKGRHVDVQVWAFRSHQKLPDQPGMKDQDKRRVVQGLNDHPDGTLGVLFLPYVDGEAPPRRNVDGVEEERTPVPKPPKVELQETKKIAHHVSVERGKAVARHMTFDEVVTVWLGRNLRNRWLGC
ncbi:unnamed protein product [Alopecurus aequalis]